MKCPNCESIKTVLQLHWTKSFHTFICGNCKVEFDFIAGDGRELESMIRYVYSRYLDYSIMDIAGDMDSKQIHEFLDKLNNMDEEELKDQISQITMEIDDDDEEEE